MHQKTTWLVPSTGAELLVEGQEHLLPLGLDRRQLFDKEFRRGGLPTAKTINGIRMNKIGTVIIDDHYHYIHRRVDPNVKLAIDRVIDLVFVVPVTH